MISLSVVSGLFENDRWSAVSKCTTFISLPKKEILLGCETLRQKSSTNYYHKVFLSLPKWRDAVVLYFIWNIF